jgi:hypothetical protein
MTGRLINRLFALGTIVVCLSAADFAAAHHVLGRPSYSLSEDSNTPPAMQAEVQIGGYLVTYMVYPAFPRPNEPGRINLYASRIDDGTPFTGEVTFRVRNDPWYSWLGLSGDEETLGVRPPDDNVFRQGYEFGAAGDYIISASFEANGEPYAVDFPLRIGEPFPVGPLGFAVGLTMLVLITVSLVQRRRSMTGKIRATHAAKGRSRQP